MTTLRHWRRLALTRQGLTRAPAFGKGLAGTLRAIGQLGYVQIDTLAVVERAHHHVLWARVPGYEPGHLNRLLCTRQIFEYWFHAASYLPMRDYRFALPRMNAIRRGEERYFDGVDERLMREILARVRADGALRARDLAAGGNGNGANGSWWNLAPGRRALDKLFLQGDLMVCERNGMEKVYDLAERVLPPGVDLRAPSPHEYAAYLLDTALRAHGLVSCKQVLHLQTGKPLKDALRALLAERMAAGRLTPVPHAALPGCFVDTAALASPASAAPQAVQLLSPFDNLVIHRERLGVLFGFDYRLECYLPVAKRVYGYFCLPILFGERFAGRIDCKARRAEKRLDVLSLHIEDCAADRASLAPLLHRALERFAAFNGCTRLSGVDARVGATR